MSLSVDEFQNLTETEHILKRYGMFIGQIERRSRTASVFRDGRIFEDRVQTSNGQIHMFLEILGNAADNVQRSKEAGVDPGKIQIDIDGDFVCVHNEGLAIPIDKKEGSKEYIPTTIFGNLRTSSNYDDSKTRLTIGTNGLGAKIVNAFSLEFHVECVDAHRQLKFYQQWTGNMKNKSKPKITKSKSKSYVKVWYRLDFPRFETDCNDEEFVELCMAHCAEIAYTCDVPVICNDVKFSFKNISDFVKLYFPETSSKSMIVSNGPNYELCLVDSPDSGIVISFVNGVITKDGGTHVDTVQKIVIDYVKNYLSKYLEGVRMQSRDIASHVSIILKCRVDKPVFDTQTKRKLVSGNISVEIPDRTLARMKNWEMIRQIMNVIESKQEKKIKKTETRVSGRINSKKVVDANHAGKKKLKEGTTLIYVEGGSASSYPRRMISQIPNGKDKYGTFEGRGKLLNVINADFTQILENEVFNLLKKTLGLQEGLDYTQEKNFNKLRYTKLLAAVDADTDGKHILGLLLVFFMIKFPSLMKRDFLYYMRTPVVRASKGNKTKSFYTIDAYDKWKSEDPSRKSWKSKYFKGLGSSSNQEIDSDWKCQNIKFVKFHFDEDSSERIQQAFNKLEVKHRKKWIEEFIDKAVEDMEKYNEVLPVTTFIDYELIHYTFESLSRAIPSARDGFKDSQRKIMYVALKELQKTKSMKVSELASAAGMVTNYKHGEVSLQDTIIHMAMDFIGSNNMGYFTQNGQFGSRDKGGKDAANPRYISVSLAPWIKYVYRKEDELIQEMIIEDDTERECVDLHPIIPMHVINGVKGVATGYSTDIPNHNPKDIIEWIRDVLNDREPRQLMPWYRNFTGSIELIGTSYITAGRMHKKSYGYEITELPVGMWTNDFRSILSDLHEAGKITDYNDYSNDVTVNFQVMTSSELSPTDFRLVNKKSTSNMTVLYNSKYPIPKTFSDIDSLLHDFVNHRLQKYEERRIAHIDQLERELDRLSIRMSFILKVIDGELVIHKRPVADVLKDMKAYSFPEHLLDSVKIKQFTMDYIDKLNEDIRDLEDRIYSLKNTTAKNLWRDELLELESHIQDYM